MCIENDLSQIKEIINEIEEKSADGGYIFRGERECNEKVSSNLYRDFDGIDTKGFDIEVVQKEMLNGAKKHTGHLPLTGDLPKDYRQSMAKMFSVREEDTAETADFEILTEIQHYGGKTNLIDFTTDYLVALFFACDGHHDKEGRVIIQKAEEIQDMIKYPRNPRHRVAGQKSVFVRHPKGFIEPHKDNIVIIPENLKKTMLQHLRKYHGIYTETIYNDLYGFIRNQDIHGDAYTQFYRGITCQNRADEATTTEVKQQEHENAIKHYTESIISKPDFTAAYNNRGNAYNRIGKFQNAIEDYNKAIEIQPDYVHAYNNRGIAYYKKGELDNAITDYNKALELKPDYDNAYYNLGEAWLHLKDWEKAKADLITAKEMGVDIIASFHNDYASVEDFEQKTGIQLPPDIAALLTPPQA